MQNCQSEVRVSPSRGKKRQLSYVDAVSPAMTAVERAIAHVSASGVPVLIVGEQGSGRRTLAYRLHELSSRRHGGIQEWNCSTVTEESFGLDKPTNGEVTSILLSELGCLSSKCQTLLLHAIESADCNAIRWLALADPNIDQDVRNGHFREDLYYRLSGACLRIPPLRLRKEDIPLLTDFLLAKYSAMFGRPEPVLSESMRSFLAQHSWPGNITELESTVKTIAATGDERIALMALSSGSMMVSRAARGRTTSLKDAARAASRQAERELILSVLSQTQGNRKRAAGELRISYKALLYKLKQIRLHDDGHTVMQGDEL